MKRILFVGIAFMAMQFCSSCSKEENNPQQSESENKSEYYVRCEAKCEGYHAYLDIISVSTSNGGYSSINYRGSSFSETFGPMPKGSRASISISPHGTPSNYVTTTIYVSKDNGPFALKARGTDYCSYTIDF